MTDQKSTILGERYRLGEILGKGSQGEVYLAYDLRLKKHWAIKKIRGCTMESEIMKKLEHPGMPRIVDILQEEEERYLVMDYFEGLTLEQMKKKEKRISWEKRIDWSLQICSILEYLHGPAKNIIYQDLKPSNILIQLSGEVKLIDFGISVDQRGPGEKQKIWKGFGTPGFAAPEQYRGESDEQSDIYALGAVMRSMEQKKEADTYLYRRWSKICRKCMETSRVRRYRKTKAVQRDLQELNRFLKKEKHIYLGTVLAAVGCLCLLGAYVRQKELLLDRGRLLGSRDSQNFLDPADYEEVRAYYQKELKGTEKGACYEILLWAVRQKNPDTNWEEAAQAVKRLEESAGSTWEKTGDYLFLAGLVQAYEEELGYEKGEGTSKALVYLQKAEAFVRENEGETYAPVFYIEILNQLGKAYEKNDQPAKALEYNEKLLKESIPEKLEADTRLTVAALYRQLGRQQEAEQWYEAYLKDFPKDAEGYCAYALMEAMECRNLKKAEEILSEMEKNHAAREGFNSQLIKDKIEDLTKEEKIWEK